MKTVNNSILLELHVPDFRIIKSFYKRLGFKVVWERKPEGMKGYLVLKMDNNIICFWAGNKTYRQNPYFKRFPRNTKRGYAVELVIIVKDVKAYYKKVKKFAKIVEPLIFQPWKLWDFRIADPLGFYLRFTTPHNILDPKNAVE